MSSSDSTDTTPDLRPSAVEVCVLEVTHEIGRLSTEVARMDATDLAAPWKDDQPSRRALVTSMIARLDPHSRIVKASEGRELSRAINHAWIMLRDRLRNQTDDDARDELVRVLHDVRELRVNLDAGILPSDIDDSDVIRR